MTGQQVMKGYGQRLAAVAVIFVFSLTLGVLVTQEGGRVPLSAELVAQTAGIYDFTWSPDEKSIAYVASAANGFEIWLAATTGGRPVQLTSTQAAKQQPRWSLDGRWIAFVALHNGNADIYAVSADGAATIPLVETAAMESNPAWGPDSNQIAYTEQAGNDGRLMILDLRTRTTRTLVEMEATQLEWSPDGKWIAFVANPLGTRDDRRENLDLFVVPVNGGTARLLTPGTQRFRDYGPSWSPNSREIAYVSDDTGYSNIYTVELEGLRRRTVTSGAVDSIAPRWSPTGQILAYARNEDSLFHIYGISLDSASVTRISDRDGVNGGFSRGDTSPYGALAWSPKGTYLAFTHSDPFRTSDIWIGTSEGGRVAQLTNSMPLELRRESRFVWPETWMYRSFDGREIIALVFKPRSIKPQSGYPAVLMYRDTLDGQHAMSWDPFIQFLVSKGYLVFAPNVRGSSGRGRDFRHLVAGNGGDHDVRDAFFGLDRLASEGLIDTEKLAVMGAGIGGFLTTASLIRAETRFKAAVSLYGIVDAVTASSYPRMSEWTRYLIGATPLSNPIPYYERSIVNFIDKLRSPIIFIYAGADTLAPLQQLQQFAVQAEVKNKWYDYRIFEGEYADWRSWRSTTMRQSLEALDVFFEKNVLGRDVELRMGRTSSQ
jgi:dipeptidyl aminopeptidase/acylaminoacyl peptidase